MTTTESQPQESLKVRIPSEGKFDSLLTRIDTAAIVITLMGICLLLLTAVVFAVLQTAKLIANLWSDSLDRWLIITVCVALIWVVARWKRSRLS